MDFWYLVLVGAGSGVVWSSIQFLNKVANTAKPDRFKDWDWLRVARTTILNGVGGGVGAWSVAHFSGAELTVPLAVAAGLYGEKGLELLSSLGGKLFPVKK